MSSQNLKHEPFYPEMCLTEAAIKCLGEIKGGVSWLTFWVFFFPPCLNSPLLSRPFAKDYLRWNGVYPYLRTSWLTQMPWLGLCPLFTGKEAEMQRGLVTFGHRCPLWLPPSWPEILTTYCWSFLEGPAPLPTFLSTNLASHLPLIPLNSGLGVDGQNFWTLV